MGYGVIIPIGPQESDIERLLDLLESLWTYEQDIIVCVLIDDSPQDRHLEIKVRSLAKCEVISIVNPRQSLGIPLEGGICASILSALRVISERGPLDFIVKIDTDALVIAPFGDLVKEFLIRHPDTGLVGTVGKTCNRDMPDYGSEAKVIPNLIVGINLVSDEILSLVNSHIGEIHIPGIGSVRREELIGFAAIRPHICRAMENGYSTLEYCQGGAYAISSKTVSRMARLGYLDNPLNWLWIPEGEDAMMGMYTRAVGLKVSDFSDYGEPFGIQYRGLAGSPTELLNRRCALIHSVKNDPNYSEPEIRKYFQQVRLAVKQ